jgi:hypothetical protein
VDKHNKTLLHPLVTPFATTLPPSFTSCLFWATSLTSHIPSLITSLAAACKSLPRPRVRHDTSDRFLCKHHPRLPHLGTSNLRSTPPYSTTSHFKPFIMRGSGYGAAAAAAIASTSMLIGRAAADVDPIVIKGSKFFYGGNGTQL